MLHHFPRLTTTNLTFGAKYAKICPAGGGDKRLRIRYTTVAVIESGSRPWGDRVDTLPSGVISDTRRIP